MNRYLKQAELYARDYDKGTEEQAYYGPELLFGLLFPYLKSGDKALDIAIGTGLDAVLLKKAGAKVFGIDGAAEMLKICREKQVADELKQMDLLEDPMPYAEASFDLAVCNSLFHMMKNPLPVFTETARVLKKGAVFAFTFDENKAGKTAGYEKTDLPGIITRKYDASGLDMYRHSGDFMKDLCAKNGFCVEKETEFLTFRGKDGWEDFYFSAYIALRT